MCNKNPLGENNKKIRKNVNVSIQSKKYNEVINDILNSWEEEGLNISTEVCNSILLSSKISKSPTLLNVLNIYDLAEKIINLYYQNINIESQSNQIDKINSTIEDVLSNIITVKGSELTDVISDMFKQDKNNTINTSQPISNNSDRESSLEEKLYKENNKSTITEVSADKYSLKGEIDNSIDLIDVSTNETFNKGIPQDFLFND